MVLHGAWGLAGYDFPVRGSGGRETDLTRRTTQGRGPTGLRGDCSPRPTDVRTLGGGWRPDPQGGTGTRVLAVPVTATMRGPRPRWGVILTVQGVLRRANFRGPEGGVGSQTRGWLIGCVNEGTRRVGLPVPNDGAAGRAAGCRAARFSPGMGCRPWKKPPPPFHPPTARPRAGVWFVGWGRGVCSQFVLEFSATRPREANGS